MGLYWTRQHGARNSAPASIPTTEPMFSFAFLEKMFDRSRRSAPRGRGRGELEGSIAFVLLGSAIVGSALGIGAIHLPVLAVVALTIATASSLTVLRSVGPPSIPPPAVLCL